MTLRILEERKFPVRELRAFASERSVGKTVTFRGEPITIRLVPVPASNQLTSVLPTVVSRVDAADPDGSFDQMMSARIGVYTVSLKGETSGKVLDMTQDPTLNLAVPSADVSAASRSTYC